MFVYEKKLQYPVKIANCNPKLASIIISQYGGRYTNRLLNHSRGIAASAAFLLFRIIFVDFVVEFFCVPLVERIALPFLCIRDHLE